MNSKKLISDALGEKMKSLGFVKKELLWNRRRGSLTDVVSVQIGKGSSVDNIQFSVNFGIFIPEFYTIVWGQNPAPIVQDADCIIRNRIETPNGGQWWSLMPSEPSDTLSSVFPLINSSVNTLSSEYSSIRDVCFSLKELNFKNQYWLTQLHIAISAYLFYNKGFAISILDDFRYGRIP